MTVGLTASFATSSSSSGGSAEPGSESVAVSPSSPIAATRRRELLVKLLGDLGGYTQLPSLG